MDITIEEREAMSKFRPIAQKLTANEIHVDDDYLLRWLRARNLNLEKAEQMLGTSMEWREKLNIKSVIHYSAPEVVVRDFKFKFTGEDSSGRPILVVPFGQWEVRAKIEAGLKEQVLQYCRRLLELINTEILRRRARGVTQFVAILDSEGLTFRKVAHFETMNTVLHFFKEFEANYPETLHSCYIVNAPWAFPYVFNIVKPLLSMRTLAKVDIYDGTNSGNKWRSVLQSKLPLSSFPKDYGGSGKEFFPVRNPTNSNANNINVTIFSN